MCPSVRTPPRAPPVIEWTPHGCKSERSEVASDRWRRRQIGWRVMRLLGLIKLFERPEYADQFLRGRLFLNTMEYFRQCDADIDRGDPYEGLQILHQGKDIGELRVGEIAIDPAGVVNMRIRPNEAANWNLFCMYSLLLPEEAPPGGTLEDARQMLLIPPSMRRMGTLLATVHQGDEFLRRVDAAARLERFSVMRNLVTYYDELQSHSFARNEFPFRKRRLFGHQREYRIVIDRGSVAPGPCTLDVGPLHDIVSMTTVDEFNRGITLVLPDGQKAGPG